MTKPALLAIVALVAGCSDRPLWFPGTGPTPGGNGANGGNGDNGGSNGNGSNGNSGGNGNNAQPVPRLVRPLSTATVTSRRPRLAWDMTGVAGAATLELCADRACQTALGSATVDASGAAAVPDQDLPAGPVFWRVSAASGASATWELFVGHAGAPVDDSYGATLDLDGDGVPDAAMNAGGGKVVIYLGGAGGLAGAPALVIPSPDGDKVGFGYALASAGDLNGDGYADLAVGECARGVGTVHVYFGAPGGPDPAASQAIASPDQLEGFGCRLAGAGDLDADGYADLAVGRVGADFSGGLYIFRGGAGGPAGTTTRIDSPDRHPSRVGYSLAGAGDLDGDGYDDLIAGEIDADDQSGQAHVYLGGPDGASNLRVVSLASPDPRSQQYGASVASAGDVNGDGYPDFVVGSPTGQATQGTPKAHLYLGGSGAIVAGMSAIDLISDGTAGFAHEVEGGADLDGDGFSDVVVLTRETVVTFRGGATVATAGHAVAAAGQDLNPRHAALSFDLDGDGTADLIVRDGAGVEILFGGASGFDRARAHGLATVPSPPGSSFSGTIVRLVLPLVRRLAG